MKPEDMEAHFEEALAALKRAQEVARKRSLEFGTPFVVEQEVSYESDKPMLETPSVREDPAEGS